MICPALILVLAAAVGAEPKVKGARSTLVHLFEWKWTDVAAECERFLAPHGYGAVQISPPSENRKVHLPDGSRPWWERYQPVSYILSTRSGDEAAFKEMTTRCNKVGVRVIADIVINHMSAGEGVVEGTGGSKVDLTNRSYPAVPYTAQHFHAPCNIDSYNDANQVRYCSLVGLQDLDHGQQHVRDVIVNYMNHLLELGVAGFRVDAAKHMYPEHLKKIYAGLRDLNPQHGFPSKTKPYIVQEVIYYGGEAIKPQEYTGFGDVTEFKYGAELSKAFSGGNALKWLRTWGEQWSLMPSDRALVFLDNHDSQRGHAGEGFHILTYKTPAAYKAAVGFMLAHPHGRPRVMSSYGFSSSDQGPPSDPHENILSPVIHQDGTCGAGWVCEHRWRQVYQMVEFRDAVEGTGVENWWDNGGNQIAFSRGGRGFVAFNIEGKDLDQVLQTGLSAGTYCDVVSGRVDNKSCTGAAYQVAGDGRARIVHKADTEDDFIAIHVGRQSRLPA